ncbi:cytochrome c1 [Emcibacter sp. SYSU 3D8]|uniref:cytochrome c1 n=1 Tax=Emcibacter sp. SYSU 3D8 TaxID=3133969 RepID=UPI0031FEA2D9
MNNKNILAGMALVLGLAIPSLAFGASDREEPKHPPQGWPHEKIIGAHYDRAAAQRGFQVYKEVCQSCHSLNLVAFRQLEGIGFSEPEIKAIAASFTVVGEPDMETGDVNDRPGKPFDYVPSPYANPEAAAASNNGAVPPDLSLMVKAREGGASYLYSILIGYHDATAEDLKHIPGGKIPDGSYYNPYKAGHLIAMPPPLVDEQVSYTEGQPTATVEQMAYDVTTFLAWAAEPKLEQRKSMGFLIVGFLLIVCGLLFFSYKRISKRVLGH